MQRTHVCRTRTVLLRPCAEKRDRWNQALPCFGCTSRTLQHALEGPRERRTNRRFQVQLCSKSIPSKTALPPSGLCHGWRDDHNPLFFPASHITAKSGRANVLSISPHIQTLFTDISHVPSQHLQPSHVWDFHPSKLRYTHQSPSAVPARTDL